MRELSSKLYQPLYLKISQPGDEAIKPTLQTLALGLMQVKIFTFPWPRLPVASIILCGWKAVHAIGLAFAEMRDGV